LLIYPRIARIDANLFSLRANSRNSRIESQRLAAVLVLVY